MRARPRLDAHTIAEEIAAYFVAETMDETVEHELQHQSAVAVIRLVLRDGREFTVRVEEN